METYTEVAQKINKPFVIFGIVWTILGSIVFWRDCPHVTPHSIYNLMYAVLILSYISIYFHYDAELKYVKKRNGNTKPLLEIKFNV
jgi:hypothetical protein